MIYFYISENSPNLDILELQILSSAFSNTYQYLRWDEADQQLKIHLSEELNNENKILLDGFVNNI